MNQQTGKYIIVAGVLIVAIGLVVYFFYDKLHWVGRLPGDIRIERENFKLYFPLTTMIVLSIIASIILQVIKRL